MQSVLVTGCNGTVGRYLTAALIEAGYHVHGASLEPTAHAAHAAFDYHQVDLCDLEAASRLLASQCPDIVVHLAALVHVRKAELGFLDYCRVNFQASQRLFELAARHGAKRIVFASTIEVYGPTPDGATIDETFPCKPDSDYARTKLLAESALAEIGHAHAIRTATLRLAPVYAPDFRLNVDKRLYLAPGIGYSVGSGEPTVDLCSVHNVPHFILSWLSRADAPSGVFNICDEKSYRIRDLLVAERRAERARLCLRLPYWPALGAVAVLQTAMNLLGRSPGMYTADNIRKLVRSAHWDTQKAAQLTGKLPWNFENTMEQQS